jgi:hypothetical protein
MTTSFFVTCQMAHNSTGAALDTTRHLTATLHTKTHTSQNPLFLEAVSHTDLSNNKRGLRLVG